MKIHAVTTGTVRVKHSFLFPSRGARRQLDLFLPGPFSDPLPIHCWGIEHQGVLRLVDAGETAAARNVPFARMQVTREQEVPAALAAAGLKFDDVTDVVLTHAHGDHIDGLVHLGARVLINQTELRSARSPSARVMRRILRQPLPPGFAPETFVLDGGPYGAFRGAGRSAMTDASSPSTPPDTPRATFPSQGSHRDAPLCRCQPPSGHALPRQPRHIACPAAILQRSAALHPDRQVMLYRAH